MSRTTHFSTVAAALVVTTMMPVAHAEIEISGQINRMIASMDNGVDSEVQHLDNSGTGTRLRIKGEHDAGHGIKVGFYWETQYQSNDSSDAEIRSSGTAQNDLSDDITDDEQGVFQVRHRDLYFKGEFGKISLGQGNGAANGITEMEYTGTTFLTGYASPEDIWGELNIANSGGLEVKDVYDGMDGLSRSDRLRYDTPEFGPFTVSVDSGNGGKIEKAIRFDANLGSDSKIKGGYATWDRKDASNSTRKGSAGSLAFLHGSGLNAAVAFGELDNGNPVKPKSRMLILGFKRGAHAFSVRRGTTDDKETSVSADATEVGYVNRYLKGADLYVGYQIFETDISGAEDVTILFAGARVKF